MEFIQTALFVVPVSYRVGIIIFLCLYLYSHSLTAQKGPELREAIAFHEDLGIEDRTYINGRAFIETRRGVHGHPFFIDESWQSGRVQIKGRFYADLNLRYDAHLDQLQYNHFSHSGPHILIINPRIIRSFELDGHKFVPIRKHRHLEDGFYELAHEGSLILYISHRKYIQEQTVNAGGIYVNKKQWYLEHEGRVNRIRSRRSMLKALPGHQNEVKKFIRDNSIVVKNATDRQIISILEYYESLI